MLPAPSFSEEFIFICHMALIDHEVKDEQRVRFLKKLWCSVSGVVKYKDCFYQRLIEKIGHRGELRSW